MKRYHHPEGESGVVAYEVADDSITVRFNSGATYLYTHQSTGRTNVEHMKRLAADGAGLAAFISQYIGRNYAKKLA